MKKIFLLLTIILVCSMPVFALGGAEDTSTQIVPQEAVESSAPFRSYLLGLADIFDRITLMASIGVTPFPSMLTTDGDSIPSSIYNLSTQSDTAINSKEKSISATIGAIFVSCLVAEILYIAIFKCFLLGDLAIAKQVASVFLRGMLLFFVVINLPMIVELARTGFQELAYTIAGARLERDSSLLVMRDNVFNMPGTVIRSSIDIIEMIDPANAGGVGISVINTASAGAELGLKTITGIMVQILYWIVQIICVIFLCVCAFHVMFNVIEVYLLIGIVSVLAPFQIFEVTRFLGERAIYSLFVNLVELFVIMVILYSCQGVLISFQQWVNESYVTQALTGTGITYSLPTASPISEVDYNEIVSLATQYNIPWEQQTYDSYCADLYAVRANQAFSADRVNQRYLDILSEATVRIIEEGILNGVIPATAADRNLLMDPGFSTEKLFWDQLEVESSADNGTLLNKLSMATMRRAVDHVFNMSSVLEKYGIRSDTYSVNTDIVPIHLSSGLICVFMMFYFLGQSTQITNALMNGTAATDGFTGATMKMAAGKSLGYLGAAGAAGVKGVGSGKRAMVDAIRNNKNASQHISDIVK